MKVDLHAYQTHVFLDWKDLHSDAAHPWGELCDSLGARGVSSLDDALRDLQLKPVHQALRAILEPANAEALANCSKSGDGVDQRSRVTTILDTLNHRLGILLAEVEHYLDARSGEAAIISDKNRKSEAAQAQKGAIERLQAALKFEALGTNKELEWPIEAKAVLPLTGSPKAQRMALWTTVLGWCAVEAIGKARDGKDPTAAARAFDVLRLRGPLAEAFAAMGIEGEERWRAAARVRASFQHAAHANAPYTWTHDPDAAWVIGAHQFEGVSYVAAEQFERLLWWMALRTFLDVMTQPRPELRRIDAIAEEVRRILEIVEGESWRVESLQDAALPVPVSDESKEQKEENIERRS